MGSRVWQGLPMVVIVAGLAVDAVVHLDVAGSYALVRTSVMSQADLFRLEALVAIAAAIAVVVRRGRPTGLLALLVGGGGVAAVLFYTYVDPGVLGPVPDMFDPVWYPEKSLSLAGEAAAALGGLALLAVPRRSAGQGHRRTLVRRPASAAGRR